MPKDHDFGERLEPLVDKLRAAKAVLYAAPLGSREASEIVHQLTDAAGALQYMANSLRAANFTAAASVRRSIP